VEVFSKVGEGGTSVADGKTCSVISLTVGTAELGTTSVSPGGIPLPPVLAQEAISRMRAAISQRDFIEYLLSSFGFLLGQI
jgi:hypothetical protein